MNGSRSNNLRQGEHPSIDALNRTIQGLEARIEGLMAPPQRDTRLKNDTDRAVDSLSEIVLRQRALSGHRERNVQDSTLRRDDRQLAQEIRSRLPQPGMQPAPGIKSPDAAMQDIAQALVGLRHELKKDISDGVSREVQQLRAEIRGIKSAAGEQNFAEEMRDDMARLADSINRLGHHATPADAASLRAEFDDLRSAIDGLAREDSLRHLELRWNGVEQKLHGFNAAALQDDLLSLAYQLDDIKSNFGSMGSNPAIQSLENRLISLASEIESMGKRMQPNDRALAEQFAGLDLRLDEISRAIAAANRAAPSAAPALDPQILKSFENKLNQLAAAIEIAGPPQADMTIAPRIEALTQRVEELVDSGMAARLDERLDQLSRVMESSLRSEPQAELTDYLSDISRKIDALDNGSVNNELARQLGLLARRIDEFGTKPSPVADDSVSMRRLEGRLDDIAARLDSAPAAPVNDSAFRSLEAQIANLSKLLNAPGGSGSDKNPEYDHRIAALEDYMATSDEFIMQAARQAAEAVAEAYNRNPIHASSSSPVDVSTITALAEDLRHLEEMTRSSEQRTHRTFEALHDTLVQIAQRLDRMDTGAPSRPAPVAEAPKAEPARAASEQPAPVLKDPAPVMSTRPAQERAAEPQRDPMELVETARQDFSRLQAESEFEFSPATKPAVRDVEPPAPRAEPRAVVQPPPATDAIEAYEHSAEDSLLLEPGSGVPDVKKILAKVRAAQGDDSKSALGNKLSDAEKADFISAARRAAQAAAAEIDNTIPEAPVVRPVIQPQKPQQSTLAKSRRALLLSAGFILLGVMTYPMLNTLLRGRPSPETPAITQPETPAPAPAADVTQPKAAATDASATDGAAAPAEETKAAAPAATNTDAPVTPAATADAGTAPAADAEVPLAFQPQPEQPAVAQAVTPAEPASATPAPAELAVKPITEAAPAATPAVAETAAAPAAPVVDVPDNVGPPALVAAARTGDALALFEIGSRFTEGRGVKTDMAESAKWYGLAADKGFAPAQYRLANLYEKGNGVERDIPKAKAMYEKAAGQGNASAMHNLAVLAATGAGDKPDMEAAAKWFTKAAEMGVKDSQFNLAILYARGTGVKADLSESYKWFAIAALGGDTDAAEKRDEVAKAMKPDQLANAKAKVDLWKKAPVNDAVNNPMIPDTWTGKGSSTGSIDMKKAITNIQAILNNNGFALGKPDGVLGAKTVAAIKSFQASVGQKPTGEITDELVKALLARNKS